MGPDELAPVRLALTVPVGAERAFKLFTEGLATWWPREYSWSGDVLEDIGIEPREGGFCFELGPGGFCFELGPGGFRCDWGTVRAWDPPERLVLAWQIAPSRAPEPNPERASQVEVGFAPEGPEGTRVELEHRRFERHGDEAPGYRDALASEQGWPYILDRYAAAVG